MKQQALTGFEKYGNLYLVRRRWLKA